MARGVALAAVTLIAAATSLLACSPPAQHSPHDYGPVPAGIPTILGAAPSNPQWLTAFDWRGKPVGTMKLAKPLAHELVPEPHCFVLQDQRTFDEVLYVDVPREPPNRRVGVVITEAAAGQSEVDAVECNFRRNLAIVVRTSNGRPTDVWVVRLSDAVQLAHYSYNDVLSVVPSPDGSLVAENGANGSVTRIRSIPDGTVLRTLPAIDAIGGFSDDNRFAVVRPVITVAQIRVIDWRTGDEVWHEGNAGQVMNLGVNPGAGDLAIAVGTDEQYAGLIHDYAYAMVIVHPDGSADEIPGRYLWILPPYADGYYPYKGGPP